MSKNKIKVLGPAKAYTDIVDQAEQANSAKKTREPSLPLRPSSAGECTRALAYKMNEYLGHAKYEVEPMDTRTKMLLDLGNSVEWHCIKWFREGKEYFKSKYRQQTVELFDLKVEDKGIVYTVEGQIDECFISKDSKGVIDYKSKGDKWSSYYKTSWKDMDAKLTKIAHQFSETGWWVEDLPNFLDQLKDPFFEANFWQVNTYIHSSFFQKKGVDHGSIIQYNKNDSSKREIRFKPSSELFEKVRTKFQIALDSAADKKPELAPRDFTLGSIKCAFCAFKSQCRPDTDALKEFFRTLPKAWPKDTDRLGTDGLELEGLFKKRGDKVEAAVGLSEIDDKIIAKMESIDTFKIRLPNKEIYFLKKLKSPREHFEVRRGKL